MAATDKYLAFMGKAPKRVPHWEHWSCPDAETYLTGIDYYEHPRRCRLKLRELYPDLELPVPETDEPRPKPKVDGEHTSSCTDEEGNRYVRWGDSLTRDWDFGKAFKTAEDVLNYSPVNDPQHHDWFHNPEKEFQKLRAEFPAEWGDKPPEGQAAGTSFYNTMFMWPLLTFGWDLFLETCLDERFDRVMDEFAELNRRIFKTYARMPINVMTCHDDIVNTRGLVCSPAWMKRHIYPRYEEYWSYFKAAGIRVVFMSDGNIDPVADDVMACGADGIISEPFADYKRIARKYKDCFLAGEGDNRILMRNNDAEIKAMVLRMVETAKLTGGYMMCIGNHIPWNVPGEAIKRYFEYSRQYARR